MIRKSGLLSLSFSTGTKRSLASAGLSGSASTIRSGTRPPGPPELAIKISKGAIQGGQRVIHEPADGSQGMIRTDPLLQIDIGEQRPTVMIAPTHQGTPRSTERGNHSLTKRDRAFSAASRSAPASG